MFQNICVANNKVRSPTLCSISNHIHKSSEKKLKDKNIYKTGFIFLLEHYEKNFSPVFLCTSLFAQDFYNKLSASAVKLTNDFVVYGPSYFSISYPNGDIPAGKGVCTDVVIRAYRKLNIDLQKEVHQDMKENFQLYPNLWGLQSTDTNIDHRRVPNLMTFFARNGNVLPVSTNPNDYQAGDIVAWDIGNGMKHIGIVIDRQSKNKIPLVVHNIGKGQVIENILFSYTIIGHYRYRK